MLSRYRNFSKIGEGGMGVVYRAEDATLTRPVALKFLTTELLAEGSIRARFVREARLDASLNHPNICTVYEFGEVEPGEEEALGDGTRLAAGTPFMAMELIEGRTLQALLRESAPLSPDVILSIAGQLAEAIAAAHEHGIVHRDLKPGNVMVTEKGSVKVLDFGLAKSTFIPSKAGPEDATLKADLTCEGQLLGTVAYMSPEQARAEPVDERSDVFSIGIMLYEMATGENPFRGTSHAATLSKVLQDDPRPIAELRSEIAEDFQSIVFRCLRKRSEDRYKDALELAADLDAARSLPVAARKRSPWPIAAALAAAIIILAAMAWRFGWLPASDGDARQIRSLAVLPCQTLTGDVREDYFSEGITVDIITQLAKIGSLKVISPISTLHYEVAHKSAAEIASELGVGSLLRCDAVQVSGRIRISARLIEPGTEAVLWAESYDRSAEDILAVWSDVALQIARKLRTSLTSEEQELIARPRRVNPEAYRAYQQGRLLWRTRKRENIEKAIVLFNDAIDHDPDYAQAYAGLADAYETLPRYAHGATQFDEFLALEQEYGSKALEAANRALELDPNLAGPHATIGHQLRYWQADEGEKALRKAIELEPNYVWAHVWYGSLLSSQRRDSEAQAELELALSLSPGSQVVGAELAWVYAFSRQYDRAIAQLRATISIDPSWSAGYLYLGDVLLWARRYDEAREAYRMGADNTADGSEPFTTIISALLGDVPNSTALPRVVEIERYYGPMTAAELYSGLGEKELSLAALERAFQLRDPGLPSRILREPLLDAVRSEPRFLELVEQLGLEEYSRTLPK